MGTEAQRSILGQPLRKPPLAVGLALSFFAPIKIVVTILVVSAPLFAVRQLHMGSVATTITLGVCLVLLVNADEFANTTLKIIKLRYINHLFRTVTLRGFHDPNASYLVRNIVAPTFGCYGDVVIVADDSLHQRRGLFGDGVRGTLSDASFALSIEEEGWHKRVAGILAESDVAVIDMTRPTPHVLWETACALELLPAHRVLIVGVHMPWSDVYALATAFLTEIYPPGVEKLKTIRPIQYSGRPFGTWRFRLAVFRAMFAIAAK
jgi:hypothetical protein